MQFPGAESPPVTSAADVPYLAMRHISKSYPGVQALDDVSFDVRRGEVHALVGENGAGKSTLVKVLAGAVTADKGDVLVGGRPAAIHSPKRAEQLGIALIYQEFNLIPGLSVAENVMLGREPTRGFSIDWHQLRERAARALARLHVELPLNVEVRTLSIAQQQMVEIAKALSTDARIIVMDEPSAALTTQEVRKLFDIIAALKRDGVGIVYISHRLEEIFAIADRVTIFRDGKHVKTDALSSFTQDDMIRFMVGRNLAAHFPTLPPEPARAQPLLSVQGLTMPGRVNDISLDLYAGEIVGFAGLIGSGRTSLLRGICGADPVAAGTMLLEGKPFQPRGPHDAIEAGLALVTEDRKSQGLILGMSVRENVTLPHLADFVHRGRIDRREEAAAVAKLAADLHIRTPTLEQLVRNLSGGNQQKVVLAKWLLQKAKIICFDEPTRGIDIGAKAEIYELMSALAASGTAILMASSELPEVLGMSMRIAVMHEGRIARIFARGEGSQEEIMRYAVGTVAA
ncbi:MAG: D-xylose ABC transporter ATP-binding protein [Candidatus Eremiobacter antarcticus]|nr:sugar ABC transporter ATP-binding protein [Candidatus Eremiobacteraeota bacterium]MBC5808411.1 sugar ABC transporter ATP-binding protein [Candidatus Eremiobacteraeota bacterium]PZR63771.1 MAG: D-xylose ABC transporter ATP-binding protein [Candidatus Eremiobacter sp. RRmetagenome_bin22]